MEAFEKLEIWKRSSRLCVDVYSALTHCRDLGFKDQMTRAALSVPSNIAEGHERDSLKDYVRFLRIAKGSCGELRTQLYIAKALGILDVPTADRMLNEAFAVSRMIQGLVRALRRQTAP